MIEVDNCSYETFSILLRFLVRCNMSALLMVFFAIGYLPVEML